MWEKSVREPADDGRRHPLDVLQAGRRRSTRRSRQIRGGCLSERGTGLWLVKGDRDVLMQLHDTEEARLLVMRGELLIEAFSLDFCYAGEDANDDMMRYGSALSTIS